MKLSDNNCHENEGAIPSEKKILLGLGLDNDDGQKRLTRGKNFTLWGGSEETHALMQETVIKVNEELQHHGKTMDDVSLHELGDIVQEVSEKVGTKRINRKKS